MLSFDVMSLFTSTPTTLALKVTRNRLETDPTISERTNLSMNNDMKLLEMVLNNISFSTAHSTSKYLAALWVHH